MSLRKMGAAMQTNSIQLAQTIYNEGKFWAALGGALWSVFKAIAWVRSIKENDLHHLQTGVNDMKDGLNRQTELVVGELKELRADFRSFSPQPVRARATRKAPMRGTRRKK